MESRRKRKRSQITKWVCYALVMLLCTVLQTLPGLFRLGEAKPLWLLPLALASGSSRIAATCFRCFGRSRKLHSRIAACERKAIASGETLRISRPSKVVVLTPSLEIRRYSVSSGPCA